MIDALENLLKLQAVEFGEVKGKAAEKEKAAAELRGQIPAPILAHYDRLRVRGKKGIVPVRNQVCAGCHMSIPIGTITVLMRGQQIELCSNCSRYLYWPEPVASPEIDLAAVATAVEKAPKRRTPAQAAPGRMAAGL